MCKHELKSLRGTAEGIRCIDCGKLFLDMAAVEKDRKPAKKPTKKDDKG
jgi:hypothetical protein